MPSRLQVHLHGAAEAAECVSAAQAHGLACALVEEEDRDHHAPVKPFALQGIATPSPSRGESAGSLVIGWLDDERVPAWESWHQKETRLGARPVQVRAVEQETASYADLATSAAASRVGVVFEAPALVRRGGRNLPLPEPELLMSGLLRRWNAFSPLVVPEPQAAELLASVYVARHEVRTVPLELRGQGRAGFVGTATFGLSAQAPLALRRWLAALWRFASFSGVGAHTTHGLGQVTVYPGEDPPSAGASRSRRRSADHGARSAPPRRTGAAR